MAASPRSTSRRTTTGSRPGSCRVRRSRPSWSRRSRPARCPTWSRIDNPVVPSFSAQGVLEDLTDLVAESDMVKPDNYFEGPWNSVLWEDRIYGVPRDSNTLALYYNADMFREKGLDPDNPPKTWSELMAAAEKLRDPEKNVFGFGFCALQSEEGPFQWLPFLYQNGGSIEELELARGGRGAAAVGRLRREGPGDPGRHQHAPVRGRQHLHGGQRGDGDRRPLGAAAHGEGRQVRLAPGAAAGQGRQGHPRLLARRLRLSDPRRARSEVEGAFAVHRVHVAAGDPERGLEDRAPGAALRHRGRGPAVAAGLRGLSRAAGQRPRARPASALAGDLAADPARHPGGADRQQDAAAGARRRGRGDRADPGRDSRSEGCRRDRPHRRSRRHPGFGADDGAQPAGAALCLPGRAGRLSAGPDRVSGRLQPGR